MANSWIEITCDVSSDVADTLAEYLFSWSGNGVCVENRSVDAFSTEEISLLELMTLKAYLAESENIAEKLSDLHEYLHRLVESFPDAHLSQPVINTVTSEDWSNSWKEYFKPLRIGKRLLIVPTWEDIQPAAQDLVIRIDPGMAFGTGGHETTRLCLELLEQLTDELITIDSLLDLGTGSGILAMAASLLGVRRICAYDIDPDAIVVAQENFSLNGFEGIESGTTPLEMISEKFEVILANILAEELVRLAPYLVTCLKDEGYLILSGILREKEQLVARGFADLPVTYVRSSYDGEWVAMLYKKSIG